MKKTILGSFIAGALVAFSALGAQAADVIKFGVAAEPYPPYSSKDASGKWVGWEIDLMNAVCAEMKAKCELVEVAWDGIIPSLLEKKIDVIWSSMSITDERRQKIDFTSAYYDNPTVIIGAKSDATKIDFAKPESVKGKIFGVQTSTIHANFVNKYFGKTAEVKLYDTLDNALADLAAGRVDYVQEGRPSLTPFLETDKGKGFEIKAICPQDKLLGEGVGGGVRKDDQALRAKLSAAIDAIKKNGKWEEITKPYTDLDGNMIKPM